METSEKTEVGLFEVVRFFGNGDQVRSFFKARRSREESVVCCERNRRGVVCEHRRWKHFVIMSSHSGGVRENVVFHTDASWNVLDYENEAHVLRGDRRHEDVMISYMRKLSGIR